MGSHEIFLGKEFLNPSIFETDKVKELKNILKDVYEKVTDITRLQQLE